MKFIKYFKCLKLLIYNENLPSPISQSPKRVTGFSFLTFAKLYTLTAIRGNMVERRHWTGMTVLKERVQDI